jgi:hypothetical protein
MPVSEQTVTVKVHNRERLRHHVALVHDVLAEMRGVNLNNTPLQWHTKLRWEEQLEQALLFFHQFLPPSERNV